MSIYVVLIDVNVQDMMARTVAGMLTNNLGTEVKIKALHLTPDVGVEAEDVLINDKYDNVLLQVGRMKVTLGLTDRVDAIKIRDFFLDDFSVQIIVYEDHESSNLVELFNIQPKEKKEKVSKYFEIIADDISINNGHLVVWNQNRDNPERKGMDYSYIDIDDINIDFDDVTYTPDTISAFINNISAKDRCGFKLDTLRSDSKVYFSSKCLIFDDMTLKSHAISLDMDLRFYYNNLKAYSRFVDSIDIDAEFRPSQLTLSDLKYFAPTLEAMTDTLQITGEIDGFVRDFYANDFGFSFKDSTDFRGDIEMVGLPVFMETRINADVKELNFTYQDLTQLALPGARTYLPLPEFLSSLKDVCLVGQYEGYPNNFMTDVELKTNLGELNIDCRLNNDLTTVSKPVYKLLLNTDSLNVREFINMKDDVIITMNTNLEGSGFSKEDADLEIGVDIDYLRFMKNDFNNFSINGIFENKKFMVSTDIDSEVLDTEFNAMADLVDDIPAFDINLNVNNIDLSKFNVIKDDRQMQVSTELNANFKGLDVNELFGELTLDKTSLTDDDGTYLMDSLRVLITKNNKYRDVDVNCDFFDIHSSGILNVSKASNTFKNLFLNHFHIKSWTDKGIKLDDEVLDFYFSMNFKNTETLSRFFAPDLHISENTSLLVNFSKDYMIHSNFHSNRISFKNFILKNFQLTNSTEEDKLLASISIEDLILREGTERNPNKLSIENLLFSFDIHNDSILFNLKWNDDNVEDRNKGLLKAYYVSHDSVKGGVLNIPYTKVVVNDSLWTISPECYVDIKKSNIYIDNLDIMSGKQALKISGYVPRTNQDTLSVNFDDLDISTFDKLISGGNFIVDAIIDGGLQITGMNENLTMFSNLDVYDIAINHEEIGKADIDAIWSAPDTSIFINTQITKKIDNNVSKTLSLIGKYYTSRTDKLDFYLSLNDFGVNFLNPFLEGVLSRVKGSVYGDMTLNGSFNKPVLEGRAMLKDMACNVDMLNTYYRINDSKYVELTDNHYITMDENKIVINQLNLNDTLGNSAVVHGIISHDYLKNFKFDIDATLNNFLGMNMKQEDMSSFYGTAVANGTLSVDGGLDNIVMDINAETMPGTNINILLTSASTVNDNFIVFKQKIQEHDTVKMVTAPVEKKNKFTLNLNAAVNPSANLKIHLPSNLGNIEANGSGNIRLGLSSDEFSLYGDYVINSGDFNFNFQNIIKRDFVIKQGGTISWTGKADDADINVTGAYRTKASLASLGPIVDTVTSNVNVDCLLHLQDKLTNPSVSFGLALPNANDDIKNHVYSVIDTTNQAVMSQQMISLLVLGTFSYSSANLNTLSASTYYGVLTSSLSNWLSQISKDFDIGVRYTPKDNITQEELEVALSTQLFNDRLTIEGNLGMYTDKANLPQSASNIVGDVDISFKITNRLSIKAYNHSNVNTNYYAYSYEYNSPYTQGVGISYSQSFDNVREIFARKNRNKKVKKTDNKNKNE